MLCEGPCYDARPYHKYTDRIESVMPLLATAGLMDSDSEAAAPGSRSPSQES
jgi:hypothetical protein